MLSDEALLSKAKELVEVKVCWGNSGDWTNQDFIALSKRIRAEIGSSVSHVTLKRLWGKMEHHGLPQIYTLNTLVQFVGYVSWRDFKVKSAGDMAQPGSLVESNGNAGSPGAGKTGLPFKTALPGKMTFGGRMTFTGKVTFAGGLIGLAVAAIIIALIPATKRKKADPKDYAFNTRKILTAGIPNSVVFDFDATESPSDSVIIQQSWDTRLRTKVSKFDHEHTLIYYFPGFFNPKLVVDGQIMKEQDLLIPSDGWVSAIVASQAYVYFKKEDFIGGGKMYLPIEKIKAQNIPLAPQAPLLSYCNVRDFGEIYTDDFVFETSLRNEYREGSSICQLSNIYLLCEGTAIHIPLCAKGCESNIDFFFTEFQVSGKQKDLSSFGADFSHFVKVRVESAGGKADIFLNGRLAYRVDHDIIRSKIIGIDLVFQGTGSVDYVRLSNKKASFDDEF